MISLEEYEGKSSRRVSVLRAREDVVQYAGLNIWSSFFSRLPLYIFFTLPGWIDSLNCAVVVELWW